MKENIYAYLAPFLNTALIVALVLAAYALLRKIFAGGAKDAEDWKRVYEVVRGALPWLVTNAEALFGPKTGPIKLADVAANVLEMIPERFKGRLDPEKLARDIDAALEIARPIWEERPEIVAEHPEA